MPQQFGGIEDFVGALFGGGALERQAYDAATQRLIEERSRRALMDKRVAESFMSQKEAQQFGGLETLITDPVLRALTMTGTGSSFSAAQTGLGTGQQNQARAQAQEVVNALMGSGQAEGVDALNLLLGVSADKLLGPTNVQVQRQAGATAGANEALASLRGAQETVIPSQIQANEARALASQAAAALSGARQGEIDAGLEAITGESPRFAGPPPGETVSELLEIATGPVNVGAETLGRAGSLFGFNPSGGIEKTEAITKINSVRDRITRALVFNKRFPVALVNNVRNELNNIQPGFFTGVGTAQARVRAVRDSLLPLLEMAEAGARDPSLSKAQQQEQAQSANDIRAVLPFLIPEDNADTVTPEERANPTLIEGFDQLTPDQQQRLIQAIGQGG